MVEAAVEANERFSADRVEVDAGRPMHSVETVGILKGAVPASTSGSSLRAPTRSRTCCRGGSPTGCWRRW